MIAVCLILLSAGCATARDMLPLDVLQRVAFCANHAGTALSCRVHARTFASFERSDSHDTLTLILPVGTTFESAWNTLEATLKVEVHDIQFPHRHMLNDENMHLGTLIEWQTSSSTKLWLESGFSRGEAATLRLVTAH